MQNNLIVTLLARKRQDAILHYFEYKYRLSCHAEMVPLLENGVFLSSFRNVRLSLSIAINTGDGDCSRSRRHCF